MKLERGKLRRQGVLLYLAAFSMIVVLIIAIMGGYLYRFYHRTIYENFVESNEADLGAIESRHENDMEIISNVVSQINLSADCTEFMLDKQPLKKYKAGRAALSLHGSQPVFWTAIVFLSWRSVSV